MGFAWKKLDSVWESRSLASMHVKNANTVSVTPRILALLSALLLLCGCGASTGRKAEEPPKTVSDWFAIRIGDVGTRLQIAVTRTEQEHGLMERTDLGADEGMIFVYRTPQSMSYWMRDTPTPLDIGFFDADGVLREVYPMYPYDENPVSTRGDNLKFAVEMKQGWYASRGITPGAKLDLKALSSALKARGFEPANFSLP